MLRFLHVLVTMGGVVILGLGACSRSLHLEPDQGPATEWPNYGNDAGGSRYSSLAQINRTNVAELQVAWTYRTHDVSDGSVHHKKSSFEATPLLVGGSLFVVTPFSRVICLDPETGVEKWTFDPHIDRDIPGGDGFVSRGLASWRDPQSGRLRILLASLDARLIALDAATGTPIREFGHDGEVRLGDDVGVVEPGEYHVTSPPAVVGDRVVVGSSINDGTRTTMPSGVVRAFDVRDGRLAWKWQPIPRDPADRARSTWAGTSADTTGAGNAWSVMSVDAERDLVFLPTGSASTDHYGGERLGDNRYTDSVVALRGATGAIVWQFQTVHHDLWDYDVPAQPVLVDIGGVAALVQPTKTGNVFVLNRETGKPIFEVEERPVPASDVPGEVAAPTQPFPLLPKPIVPQSLKPDDAWGLTPIDRSDCAARIAAARSEGIFTPPSIRGTIEFPGIVGGSNWGSAAFDAPNGLLILNSNRLAFEIWLVARDQLAAARAAHPHAELGPQRGTPYAMLREPLLSKLDIPCNAPPWGALTAIDLRTGATRWEVPLGTIRRIAPVPLPIHWGTPNLGGPIVTAGGLTFIGASIDDTFRAFDTATGAELWKADLPVGAQSTPMTYRSRANGRQYVVVCAGGHGRLTKTQGDYVIAYALP
jgi:quinoprotein glucose dehydrogenase